MPKRPPEQIILAMHTTDYILDSVLVLLVLLQIRERPLRWHELLRPVVIVGVFVVMYLKGIPTAGNDLVLVGAVALVGATIGVASGLAVRMRVDEQGRVTGRGSWASGIFWVLGMGSRFAFAVWMNNGGAHAIATFSAHHSITSAEAWTAALLGMAVCEVLGRTIAQAIRWQRLSTAPRPQLAIN
jgi:hypothetical protein